MCALRRLEQLDRIAIGIFYLDLLAAWAGLHVIAKTKACFLQLLNAGVDVVDAQDHAIPPAGFLALSVWHGTRARRAATAEKNLDGSDRHSGEIRKLLVLQLEAELLCVKRDRALHVINLVSNAVKIQDKVLVGDGGCFALAGFFR